MLGNQAYKPMKYQDVNMDMILVGESRQTSLLAYCWCTRSSGRSFHVSALQSDFTSRVLHQCDLAFAHG